MGIASRPEVVQGEPTSCGGETPVHMRDMPALSEASFRFSEQYLA